MPGPLTSVASMPTPRVPALDGVRGAAIVWVVFHNATDMAYQAPRGGLHVLAVLSHSGWIGVQVFFALSGFLITAGLLDSRGADNYFSGFFARRALRILPLYYTVLLALLVFVPCVFSPGAPFSASHQWPLWLFVSNWNHDVPYGFAHFWSLAVEEQFYLVWPLVVFCFPPRKLLFVCLWIALGALLLRVGLVLAGAGEWTLYAITPARMDALSLGAAGACLVRMPHEVSWLEARRRMIAVLAAIVLIVSAVATHLFDRYAWPGQTVGYSVLAACAAVFVMLEARPTIHVRQFSLFSWAPLRSFGKYSYAIYLFHGLLHKLLGEPWLVARYGAAPPAGTVLRYATGVLLISYILGFGSYQLLEKRFLRLKPAVQWPASASRG
jgi:peptidoglycan/LPS O-acetylase OafA/YrhL